MNLPTPSTRMFQITEDDLEVLECELPNILDLTTTSTVWNQRKDIQEAFAMVKQIVSNVRWNYGPPSEVHRVDGGEEPV